MIEIETGTKFERWIKGYTVPRLVNEMRKHGPKYAITLSAAYQWVRGDTEPRAIKIHLIVELSEGGLTFQDVHDHIKTARIARAERLSKEVIG